MKVSKTTDNFQIINNKFEKKSPKSKWYGTSVKLIVNKDHSNFALVKLNLFERVICFLSKGHLAKKSKLDGARFLKSSEIEKLKKGLPLPKKKDPSKKPSTPPKSKKPSDSGIPSLEKLNEEQKLNIAGTTVSPYVKAPLYSQEEIKKLAEDIEKVINDRATQEAKHPNIAENVAYVTTEDLKGMDNIETVLNWLVLNKKIEIFRKFHGFFIVYNDPKNPKAQGGTTATSLLRLNQHLSKLSFPEARSDFSEDEKKRLEAINKYLFNEHFHQQKQGNSYGFQLHLDKPNFQYSDAKLLDYLVEKGTIHSWTYRHSPLRAFVYIKETDSSEYIIDSTWDQDWRSLKTFEAEKEFQKNNQKQLPESLVIEDEGHKKLADSLIELINKRKKAGSVEFNCPSYEKAFLEELKKAQVIYDYKPEINNRFTVFPSQADAEADFKRLNIYKMHPSKLKDAKLTAEEKVEVLTIQEQLNQRVQHGPITWEKKLSKESIKNVLEFVIPHDTIEFRNFILLFKTREDLDSFYESLLPGMSKDIEKKECFGLLVKDLLENEHWGWNGFDFNDMHSLDVGQDSTTLLTNMQRKGLIKEFGLAKTARFFILI